MNELNALKAPISVNLELTDSCNLACFFCFCATNNYKNALPIASNQEKLKNLHRILDVLAENEIFEIRWFGGEFTLLKGWQELVDHAYQLGFFMSFVSNGTKFSPNDADFLASRAIQTGSISIHGIGLLHDEIVQRKEAFNQATNSIRMLRDVGIEVAVLFTPNEKNLKHLEFFVRQMLGEYGATSVGINRLFQSNRYNILTLTQYRDIFRIINSLHNENLPVFFVDGFPFCKIPVCYWQYLGACSQGIGFAQVDYMGNIKNCSGLSVNIGNILNENLGEIWRDRLAKFRRLEHLPLSCRLCPVFCGGGCIASRTTEHNFVADEFINMPDQESFYATISITIQNYLKKILAKYYNRNSIAPVRHYAKKDVPCIGRRYKVRRENQDKYICMIEGRGVVNLNLRSYAILMAIDGIRTADEIISTIKHTEEITISNAESNEVLNVFCSFDNE